MSTLAQNTLSHQFHKASSFYIVLHLCLVKDFIDVSNFFSSKQNERFFLNGCHEVNFSLVNVTYLYPQMLYRKFLVNVLISQTCLCDFQSPEECIHVNSALQVPDLRKWMLSPIFLLLPFRLFLGFMVYLFSLILNYSSIL